jgi:hypothetical protein
MALYKLLEFYDTKKAGPPRDQPLSYTATTLTLIGFLTPAHQPTPHTEHAPDAGTPAACSAARCQSQSAAVAARNPPLGFVAFVQPVSCSSGLLR